MNNFEDAKRYLLNLYQEVCPTGKEFNKFTKRIQELELSGESEKNIIKVGTGILYDGLAYGNW